MTKWIGFIITVCQVNMSQQVYSTWPSGQWEKKRRNKKSIISEELYSNTATGEYIRQAAHLCPVLEVSITTKLSKQLKVRQMYSYFHLHAYNTMWTGRHETIKTHLGSGFQRVEGDRYKGRQVWGVRGGTIGVHAICSFVRLGGW